MGERHPMSISFQRRDFIRIIAVSAPLSAAAVWLSRRAAASRGMVKIHETRLTMGSLASLTLLARDEDQAREALQATFDRMGDLEALLSRFRPESQLSRLNRVGSVQGADPAFLQVLQCALDYSELTRGAFDVSVEPLLRHFRQSGDESRIAELLQRVDYRRIQLREAGVRFTAPEMAITLDGIAKGYVIDEGVRRLGERGFDQVLVEVGGDLMAGSGGWRIGIQSPRSPSDQIANVSLTGQALATSGDYLNCFSQDYRLHHILDPRQGISPAQVASVSVTAPTAMDADALSTSLMVLGVAEALQLVEQLPGVEALLVGKDLSLHASSHFPLERHLAG